MLRMFVYDKKKIAGSLFCMCKHMQYTLHIFNNHLIEL